MAWGCDTCSRYWGRCHKVCPLCISRMPLLMWLQRVLPAKEVRVLIQDFLGGRLRKGYSLCWTGSPRNCRCHNCQRPVRSFQDDDILKHRGRKGPSRRVKAARWIHFLSGAVALSGNHGYCMGCSLRPSADEDRVLDFCVPCGGLAAKLDDGDHGSADGLSLSSCSM